VRQSGERGEGVRRFAPFSPATVEKNDEKPLSEAEGSLALFTGAIDQCFDAKSQDFRRQFLVLTTTHAEEALSWLALFCPPQFW
jgi:hypothetical protein